MLPSTWLGMELLSAEDYEQAEAILLKAKKAMESLSFPWKGAQLEVYTKRLAVRKGLSASLGLAERKKNWLADMAALET